MGWAAVKRGSLGKLTRLAYPATQPCPPPWVNPLASTSSADAAAGAVASKPPRNATVPASPDHRIVVRLPSRTPGSALLSCGDPTLARIRQIRKMEALQHSDWLLLGGA